MATDLPVIGGEVDEKRRQDDEAFRQLLKVGVKRKVTIQSEAKPVPFDVLSAKVADLEARLVALEKGNE